MAMVWRGLEFGFIPDTRLQSLSKITKSRLPYLTQMKNFRRLGPCARHQCMIFLARWMPFKEPNMDLKLSITLPKAMNPVLKRRFSDVPMPLKQHA